jgi:hypothetical protein
LIAAGSNRRSPRTVVAGVLVRQPGLAENGVLKGKAGLVVLIGFNRLDQAAVNTAQRVGLLRSLDGWQLEQQSAE